MIDKQINITLDSYDVLGPGMEKVASAGNLENPVITELPEPFDPEFLYLRVRSISAGEYWSSNKNGDFFSEKELRESYHTFLDAHVFKNHANKDVANAIGSILLAEWNNDMKYVELLIKVDRKLAPSIVRGLEKGYTTDVSMGCRIKHSVCSICGNVAKVRSDFCEHIRRMRNQILADGRKVFEYNIGPRFHDLSIVLNGADRTAKVLELIREGATTQKVAHPINIEGYLEKCASTEKTEDAKPLKKGNSCASKSTTGMKKLADIQKEIVDKLYVLAIINKMSPKNLSDEEIQAIVNDAKEASIPLYLELGKTASTAKHIRNLSLGTLGIAAATNHYQGKRLRGEELSSVQNFIADNPGVLPIAFLAFGYPGYLGAKRKLKDIAKNVKDVTVRNASEDCISLIKEAALDLELAPGSVINVFESAKVAGMFKKAYHDKDNTRLTMTKLALILDYAGNDNLASLVKEKYAITNDDINNFIEVSSAVIDEHIDKEASYLRGILDANLIAGNHKIPTGLTAPTLVGSLVDGFLIHKFFYNDRPGEVVAKKVQENVPAAEKIPILNIE